MQLHLELGSLGEPDKAVIECCLQGQDAGQNSVPSFTYPSWSLCVLTVSAIGQIQFRRQMTPWEREERAQARWKTNGSKHGISAVL